MPQRKPLTPEQLSQLQSEIIRYTEGFDLIADHVVITDPDANILYANKGMEQATGFSISEIIGKTPGDLWGGIMDESDYRRMWQAIKVEKKPYVGEVQNRKKGGDLYWQEVRIFPVLDKKGEVRFYIGIEPDITIEKVFESHTKQYIGELERLNKYLEEREAKIKELTEEIDRLKK